MRESGSIASRASRAIDELHSEFYSGPKLPVVVENKKNSSHSPSMPPAFQINTSKHAVMSIDNTELGETTTKIRRQLDEERDTFDYMSLKTLGRRGLPDEEGCSEAKMNEALSKNYYRGHTHENPQGRVHKVATTVTIIVKDINDNAPIFPESIMMGEVQENGPVGLSVVLISAWDADDGTEGLNARITYSIEKNVIDEETGMAIFNVNAETGVIRTSLCCLDRETTPEYQIQVVATDGGGLKGTGTVIIRIGDENDNSPKLPSERYDLEMDETWGEDDPDPVTPLLEVTTLDPDIENNFIYRIMKGSGWGWDFFHMRTQGRWGQLYAHTPMDFEDVSHRRQISFKIQVTDKGEEGWIDPAHVDSAWVKVCLRDVNDNAPVFEATHAHMTVREDASKGTTLAKFHAYDPDMGGDGAVDYKIANGWEAIEIDSDGVVKIRSSYLDREALEEDTPVVRILGVDRGRPPLTSTATLTITVMDINDCPPYILPPTVYHVSEGAPPTRLGLIKAYDDDLWALGNGPPFNFSLAPTNPPYIRELIALKFDRSLDNGRGAATLWTLQQIDREEHHHLAVEVMLTDAKGLTNTQTVTVVVDDLNDNLMKPGDKTVYLFRTQGGSGIRVPLGRVYVEDPDDWDIKDKTFEWAKSPHPLFTLDEQEGTIFASSQVKEGRYQLEFVVSDRVWSQRGISANVTVIVKTLEYKALLHATPITLFPTTPAKLTKGWNPMKGGGGLGKLMKGVLKVVGEHDYMPEIVSVYDNADGYDDIHNSMDFSGRPSAVRSSQDVKTSSSSSSSSSREDATPPTIPSVSVWLTVRNKTGGNFMNPVKVKGLLSLHEHQLEVATGLNVTIEGMDSIYSRLKNKKSLHNQSPTTIGESKYQRELRKEGDTGHDKKSSESRREEDGRDSEELQVTNFYTKTYRTDGRGGPSTLASLSSSGVRLQVIDTNDTSLVTPRLKDFYDCRVPSTTPVRQGRACNVGSCLNGGRCIRFSSGSRCICPGGSWGSQCKVLSQTFMGSGWTWLPSLPPCLPSTISMMVLTRQQDALLLYSGPVAPTPYNSHSRPTPLIAIQLAGGHPQLIFDGMAGSLKLQVDTLVSDGSWHTIHVRLDRRGVSIVTDACGRGWRDQEDDAHCATRAPWIHPDRLGSWVTSNPLQVGGLAHDIRGLQDYWWAEGTISQPLNGCLSHISINGQLMDLGDPPLSHGTASGCQSQDQACVGTTGGCGLRGECHGGLEHPRCVCTPGFSGPECHLPTLPATLGPSSYHKVALSFTPSKQTLRLQIRLKAQGLPDGLLLRLADHHAQHSLTVQLRAGKVCMEESVTGEKPRLLCIEGFLLGDNDWHLISAERHGHNLKISVDDGDGFLNNESYPSLVTHTTEEWVKKMPVPLEIDRNDGVTVGGVPEYTGTKLLAVHNDLRGVCIDDLRISGHQIPIPPGVNNSKWGQVTTQEGLLQGCVQPDICHNISCKSPLTCTPTWPEPSCSCGRGLQSVGNTCRDINECLWGPCLNGGSCYNLRPGYVCKCDTHFIGDSCQFRKWDPPGQPLTAPTLIATITISLLILVLLGLILSIRYHCLRNQRPLATPQDKDNIGNHGNNGTVMVLNGDKPGGRQVATTMRTTKRATEEVEVVVLKENPPHDPHLEFMERLRLSHQTSLIENEDETAISSAAKASASDECTSNFMPWDQQQQQPTNSYTCGEETSLRGEIHIATLSSGKNPG